MITDPLTPPRYPVARFLGLVALGLLGCTGSEGSATATVDALPGGGVRVTNVSPADSGRWRLVPVGEVRGDGGAEGDFTLPEDLVLTDDGELLVVDGSPTRVLMFDTAGTFLGQLGRTGAGPGEYQQARVTVHGDTIIVADPSLDRLVHFDRGTREAVRTVPNASRLNYFPISADSLGRIVGSTAHPVPPEGGVVTAFLRRGLDGVVVDSLLAVEPPPTERAEYVVMQSDREAGRVAIPFTPVPEWAFDRGGNLVLWDGDRYELRRSASGLDTMTLFSRPIDPVAVTDAERQAAIDGLVERGRRFVPEEVLRGAFDPTLIPANKPIVRRVLVDANDRVWIQLASDSGAVARFDLFDAGGRWLDQVTVPADDWVGGFAPMAVGSDRLAVVVEDPSGALVVRVYRLQRE